VTEHDRPVPLSDAAFQILLALGEDQRHGYEIMQALTDSGLSRTGPTTLYRTIASLQRAGLIEESDQRPANDDERRRYYRLTSAGRDAASDEIVRLQRLLAHAEKTAPARRLRPGTVHG